MTERYARGPGDGNFDFALSFLIDKMIAEPDGVGELAAGLDHGDGELTALVALARQMRAVPEPRPRAAWVKATKERLMNAPAPREKRRGTQFLPAMMLPARYLLPNVQHVTVPQLAYKAMIVLTLATTATSGLSAVRQHGLPAANWAAGPTQVQLPGGEVARADVAKGASELRQLASISANGTPVSADQAALAAAQLRAAEQAANVGDGSEPEVNAVLAELTGLELLLEGVVNDM
ncbi:MAG: hypothetical protein KGJ86_22465, partial [Chloroflexota bacterium]|nr:hypothetical protein [Chloroflexota bacterium]